MRRAATRMLAPWLWRRIDKIVGGYLPAGSCDDASKNRRLRHSPVHVPRDSAAFGSNEDAEGFVCQSSML